jgi:1,4-alpha-glucan branching enzyme
MIARDECVRAALAIELLAPSPPLLFMGEEFAAATPFLFFCDFEPELAAAVTRGRREEFRAFAQFADPAAAERIPDSAAIATYEWSKLDWGSLSTAPHAEWHALYRDLLALRHAVIVPLVNAIVLDGRTWRTWGETALAVTWPLHDGRVLQLDANLGDRPVPWSDPANCECIYATPDVEWRDRVLQPWSVVWRISDAQMNRETAR